MIGKLLGNAGAVSVDKLHKEFGKLLGEGEAILAGFRVYRDTWIFTSNRLIIVDVQGMTGRKREYLSIPYEKITMFSVETTGTFELDAELKIWIGSRSQPVEKKFDKSVDVYAVQG
ncbi:MAG: PH domain-containing protein, partial [Chloroflexi bacterium]|nr:PH domain-containing protein [Chloroflexota bacterium]